jgi:hypothetical protein
LAFGRQNIGSCKRAEDYNSEKWIHATIEGMLLPKLLVCWYIEGVLKSYHYHIGCIHRRCLKVVSY